MPWNVYHAFESDGVRVFETQLNSFTEQTHRLRVIHSIEDFFEIKFRSSICLKLLSLLTTKNDEMRVIRVLNLMK
jgi:hypothetical protein